MKKLNYLLSALLIASIGLVGCDNAEDNEGPSIADLKVGTTTVTGESVTVLPGATSISFTANDDDEVASVTVSENGVSTPVYTKADIGKASEKISFDYTVTKNVTLIIKVVDNDDKETSLSFAIRLDAGVSSYTAKLLGAQTNATEGSFLATSTGAIYLQADAKTNASIVDIVYFYGATNFATLAAPSDVDAGSIFNNGTTGLQLWTVKNATSFKVTALTQTAFNEVNSAAAVEAAYTAASGTAASKSNNLTASKVVAFKTAAGKYGLAYVSSLTTGATGSITLDVKVGK